MAVKLSYVYQVVSGAGIFGNLCSIAEAKVRIRTIVDKYPEAEIERVLLVGLGKRYWRWRRGRWSLDWASDPTVDDLAHWGDMP